MEQLFVVGGINLTKIAPNIKIQDLTPEMQMRAKTTSKGELYLNVAFATKKEVSMYGKTHSLFVSGNKETNSPTIYLGDFAQPMSQGQGGVQNGTASNIPNTQAMASQPQYQQRPQVGYQQNNQPQPQFGQGGYGSIPHPQQQGYVQPMNPSNTRVDDLPF